MEQPRTTTPLTRDQIASLIVPGVVARFGAPPDRESAELLTALVFLENANGAAIVNHNWGNISCNASASVDFWRPPWFDLNAVQALPDTDPSKARYLELNARMKAGKVPNAFRSFPTHDAGIQFWLANVKAPMYAAASTGDPFAFAHAYWSSGYCPDQACKDSGPTFAELQKEIRLKGWFAGLASSKKKPPVAAQPLQSASLPSAPGSSGAPSDSAGVDAVKAALATVRETFLTEYGPFGYDAHSFVDFVVADTFKLDTNDLAAWYAERAATTASWLPVTGGDS